MNAPDQRPRFLFVIELDGTMSRRDSHQAHVYVGVSVEEPELRFQRLVERRVRTQFAGKFVRVMADLNPVHGIPLDTKSAKRSLETLKVDLARRGHAVNGIATKWSGYVIDLEPPLGMIDIGKGYVYVGQTRLTPDERFAVHKGAKPAPPKRDLRSKVVHRRGISLNRGLMSSLDPAGPVYTEEDALDLERAWAAELARRGFRVEAGDATPRRNRD